MKCQIIFLLIAIFAGSALGDPRVCWGCGSMADRFQTCPKFDKGNFTTTGPVICGQEAVCVTVTGKMSGGNVEIRGCFPKKDACSEIEKTAKALSATDVKCKTCTSDLCNASMRILTPTNFILFNIALLIYYITA